VELAPADGSPLPRPAHAVAIRAVHDENARALRLHAGRADVASLKEGQEATLQLLDKALSKLGVKVIDPTGEPFDPERHEAMMAQESKTAEPNSVLQVVQPGYELNGRLLRPARVIVAKEPSRA